MQDNNYKELVSITEAAKAFGYTCTQAQLDPVDSSQVYSKTFISSGKLSIDQIKIYSKLFSREQTYANIDPLLVQSDQGGVVEFVTNRVGFFQKDVETNQMNLLISNLLQTLVNRANHLEWCFQRRCQVISNTRPFNKKDWSEKALTKEDYYFFEHAYKISQSTLLYFLADVKKVSCQSWLEGNFNYAFPYTNLSTKEVAGYELRNFNLGVAFVFSKESKGFWMAGGSEFPSLVKDIYLFESAINALSFYQLHYKRYEFSQSAFIALGDYLNKIEVKALLSHYPAAKIHTCFPNEFCGNVFDIEIACIKLNKAFSYQKKKQEVVCQIDNYQFTFSEREFHLTYFEKATGLRANIRSHRTKNARDFSEKLKI